MEYSRPQLNVHLLHYRNPEVLELTLQSLFAAWNSFWQTGRLYPVEIHVWDNGSLPSEADQVQNFILKESALWQGALYFHRSVKNLGFARGHNELMRKIKAPGFVLFLNSDVQVESHFFEILGSYMEKTSLYETQVFAPAIIERGHTYLGGRIDFLRATGVMESPQKRFKNFVSGCALMVPAQLFMEAGAWNEEFFFYGEDVDLSFRLFMVKRWKLLEMADLKIYHIGKASLGGTSPLALYYHFRSRLLLIQKTWPGPLGRMSYFIVSIEILFKSVYWVLSGQLKTLDAVWRAWFGFFKKQER